MLRKIQDALRLSRFGARPIDRLRILLLTVAMPLFRRIGRGRVIRVRVRLGDQVVPWTADNYADLGVLDEVYGSRVYDVAGLEAPTVILDVGAHVGASVLYLHQHFPEADIVAIEADPGNFRKLQANVGHLANVRLINAAAASTNGTMTFYASSGLDSWKSSTTPLNAWQTAIQVRSARLDDLIAEAGAGAPEILKIDIEGAEYDALCQFAGLEHVDTILGEVHPQILGESGMAALRDVLRDFATTIPEDVRADSTFIARRARAAGSDSSRRARSSARPGSGRPNE
jgi:FkbM family methyltransferase